MVLSRSENTSLPPLNVSALGAFGDGVFRMVEPGAVLTNEKITAINGLDREHFPYDVLAAFSLIRRWDVERSSRYHQYISSKFDANEHERVTALDDFREIQLWYEMDFYDDLGPNRELPVLPDEVLRAVDRSLTAGGWKYSEDWRCFVREAEPPKESA